ncbi:MAG: formate C-acetyltransferase/glycerol dehydratase family glycyl radical enzyme [Bacteroidetes bacterium HGW-Bacteroidetes-15]|nr:MAG: formate C-acetyltransferase/glycerol dehydratase family glycyl radical enzyme [Bacteroidetes bacterium HGW-Bacteroidetes-15]
MTERISQLRNHSLNAINTLSVERAMLVTEFYKKSDTHLLSIPIQRALAFRHIMAHKVISIQPGELIVGERGPAPKATPTYPEVSLHSLDDLRILNTRPKVSFKVDDETFRIYEEEIIPFWKGKTQRDKVFQSLPQEWHDAYSAGVFTEFQEQRAPGHTVGGKKLFLRGMNDVKVEIANVLKSIPASDKPDDFHRREQLSAMYVAADAIALFAIRHAEELERLAAQEKDEKRLNELIDMIRICRKVPTHAPDTFHEALQHYWFIHLGVITELNPWDSFNPGRLDQHLLPFYKKDIALGRLTKERAVELLQAFWIKFNNHPSPPKMGVTAEESNTYTDFALINLGGVKADGSDAVNELSYIILDVIEEMRLLQPSSMVQISKKSPQEFLKRALKIVKTGFGQPSIFNTDAIIQQLLSHGKSIEDARNGGASGCVETGAFGTEAYTLSGYFNLNKVLEVTMHNGFDPRTQKQIGIHTGDLNSFKSFDDFYHAFEQQLKHFIDIKINGNNIIEKLYANFMPVPFLSILIDDCIANAKDYNEGGARYNTSYIQGVGLGSIIDNLTAISYWIYERGEISIDQLQKALKDNFAESDELRRKLVYDTPKWGNNADYADRHAIMVFNSFYKAVTGRPSARGGVFRINMLPTTCHVYFGKVIGAMPDGRLAGEPLSEGISPVQGADHNGPTAVLQSAAKIDHIKTGGTLLNQKFSPSFFASDEAMDKLAALVRTYFKWDGHHIQFNVVEVDTLRDAQKHPEKHRDLIVRVAGYSDYFNDLGEALQNEIIRRTEHGEF